MSTIDLAITPGGRVGDASPLAKPGNEGPRQLVDYVREIAHALMRKGKTESEAIRLARGILQNWASGQGDVSPKIRAAAAKALAEQATLDKSRRSVNLSADGFFDIRDIDLAAVVEDLDDASSVATDDGTVDLAPGDYKRPYDWKHGYIPITPAAALSKAKGDRKRAGKLKRATPGVSSGAGATRPKKLAGSSPALAKARDDAARGRGVPGEVRKLEARVKAAEPRGKDARTMTNAEKIKAVDIMHGSTSPAAKRARERWGTGPGMATTTTTSGDHPATPSEQTSRKLEAQGSRDRLTAEAITRDPTVSREARTAIKDHVLPKIEKGRPLTADDAMWFRMAGGAHPKGSAEHDRYTAVADGIQGVKPAAAPNKPGSIADRINQKTQADVKAGVDASGASTGSKAKGYRDLDGPRLVDEAAKRGLGGKETLSKRSDSQLRTMLKDHDKNPAASHEGNARARAGSPTPVTPEQRKLMVDRAVAGGQNRADAERMLDTTLRDAGSGTLEARLKYEGFTGNGGIPKASAKSPGDTPAQDAAGRSRAGLPPKSNVASTWPAGQRVRAGVAGNDQTVTGRVVGHTDTGMLRVAYKNDKGDTVTGTFNPAQARKTNAQPGLTVDGKGLGTGGATTAQARARGVSAGASTAAPTPKVGGLTPATASKMSDDQLDKAFERLSAAGDGPGLKAVTDEIDRREKRRAEGNRPRR